MKNSGGRLMQSIGRTGFAVAGLISFAILLQSCGGSGQNIPPLVITPSVLPNGTVETIYSQPIHATGGVAPYAWSISTGCLPHNLQLSPSSTNTSTIAGTPDTPVQAVAFTVKITDSANQSATQAYRVSILGLPDTLTVSPPGLTFSPRLTGTASGTQTVTLTNTGSSPVAIANVATAGTNAGDFSESHTCGSSLAPGANCVISVTFTPNQAGPRVAAVTITDDTTGSPHQFALGGIGLSSGANATLSAANLTFSGQAVGTASAAQTLTMTNYSIATLNIAGIAATTNFAQTNTCGETLASEASCPISVSFAPGGLGALTGALSVTDNEAGGPQTVALSGTGTVSQGTLTGECSGQRDSGGCGQVSAPASCPVGTAAINPQLSSCGRSGPFRVDNARGCQGTGPHVGHVVGLCTVN